MTIIQSVILGIVEGFTEFLPISSTAHLIITGQILHITQTDFVKTFTIAIQLGAILSVVVLYWRKFLLDLETLKKIIFAFIPTAVVGFVFYKIIKGFLMESDLVIALALLIGGIIIILFEADQKKKEEIIENDLSSITYKKAFIIGLCQSLAVIPGVSRSAATIIGGLALKISRKAIVEFSFLLAAPTMLAATGYDLMKSGVAFTKQETVVFLIGFIVSFITAMLAIKFFLRFIIKHNFSAFGVYRIVLGLGILVWFWI